MSTTEVPTWNRAGALAGFAIWGAGGLGDTTGEASAADEPAVANRAAMAAAPVRVLVLRNKASFSWVVAPPEPADSG
jgi:hypothetical protein